VGAGSVRSRLTAAAVRPAPGGVGGQVQGGGAGGDGDPPGDGEQPQPEPFRLPAAGVVAGQGEGLHPGGELAGEGDQGAPDLVLGEVVQGQVGQAGVLRGADAVLGAGAAAVPQLQIRVGRCRARRCGCWWRRR
jgi:hypothetical protein